LYQHLLLSFRWHPLTRWIIAHLDQRLTLDDLARHARLGPRQLTRHFRQMVGATPTHFVQNLRRTEAQRRLVMSDASIKRIATLPRVSQSARRPQGILSAALAWRPPVTGSNLELQRDHRLGWHVDFSIATTALVAVPDALTLNSTDSGSSSWATKAVDSIAVDSRY
jgi:hypothetical protein